MATTIERMRAAMACERHWRMCDVHDRSAADGDPCTAARHVADCYACARSAALAVVPDAAVAHVGASLELRDSVEEVNAVFDSVRADIMAGR